MKDDYIPPRISNPKLHSAVRRELCELLDEMEFGYRVPLKEDCSYTSLYWQLYSIISEAIDLE